MEKRVFGPTEYKFLFKNNYWPPLPTFWPLVDHKKPKIDSASKERNLDMKNMVFERTESEFNVVESIIDHLCPPNWPLVDQKISKIIKSL